MASKWITKLVEPPMAALTMMAFSNACRVSIFDSTKSSFTISTMRLPESCASTFRRESAAGMAAFCGIESPNASTIEAIVEAVPITAQWPCERDMHASASVKSASERSPILNSSAMRHKSDVPM